MALFILLCGAAFEATKWADSARARLELAQTDLALAQQTRRARMHGAPDAFDRAQLKALSDWSEHGTSLWLARIRVEERLVDAAAGAGLKDARISIADATEGDRSAPVLRAEVSGAYAGGGLTALLGRLSQDPKTFAFDRLRIDEADTAQFKLELLFPVQIDPPQARP